MFVSRGAASQVDDEYLICLLKQTNKGQLIITVIITDIIYFINHPFSQGLVAACFVTTARFVTKLTKGAAMPARFVTNEVMTNRAGIAPFFSHLDIILFHYSIH